MEIIDVDKLENDDMLANKKSSFLEKIKEKNINIAKINSSVAKIRKPTKIIVRGSVNKQPLNAKLIKKTDDEVFTSVKGAIFQGLSMPMKNQEKRIILKNKLENSTFMNHYLQDCLYVDYIDKLNMHTKAGLIYAYHFTNTLIDK